MLPLCLCGCGQRVKWKQSRYASYGCVPHALRATGGQKGRESYQRQQRAEAFMTTLLDLEECKTQNQRYAVLIRLTKRFYANGYSACDKKWTRKSKADEGA